MLKGRIFCRSAACRLAVLCTLFAHGMLSTTHAAAQTTYTLCCAADNDLYRVLRDSGVHVEHCTSPAQAVENAAAGSALLVLAQDYPAKPTALDEAFYQRAGQKRLHLYVEYPQRVPGLAEPGKTLSTQWERAVVASEAFAPALPRLRILTVSGCTLLPYQSPHEPLLVSARVAGFDSAVYGLPAKTDPLLFEIAERRLLVGATCLSGFVQGRYAPAAAWKTLWEQILARLAPGSAPPPCLRWTPEVRPMYGPEEPLPADVEAKALRAGAQWVRHSKLLLSAEREKQIHALLRTNTETTCTPSGTTAADGSRGILEGYASAIGHDGSQLQRTPLRTDCQAESAMMLAFDWLINADTQSRAIAQNLLDYVYTTSGMCGGVRGNPRHPAFGLIAWGIVSPLWEVGYYGDDNARVLLASMAASACLNTPKWDAGILRCLLANLRTTGKLGFRGDRIDIPQLEQNGWKHYAEGQIKNPSPHFESYLWACYLWGYRQTGYGPFLETARKGIRHTMEVYPEGWRWKDSMERARMLLALAWLVRVEDTPEHRGWLKRVASDLLALQQPCGAFIEQCSSALNGQHYQVPATNDAYGTNETPLVQANGDPASDQLYTSGFALLGLHEAAAATGDQALAQAADRLAHYLCRIQAHAAKRPELHGAWFRAFDFGRWEYWASSGDMGWGAWCIEAGWGQAWTQCVLGLRAKKTSLWQLTATSRLAEQMERVRQEMAQNDGSPWQGEPWSAASK